MTANDDDDGELVALLAFVASEEAGDIDKIDGLEAAETADARVTAVVAPDVDPNDALETLTASHERLIELAREATVLPVRIGTMIPETGISADLDRVLGQIGRFGGRVEARIIGEYDEDKLIERIEDRIPRGGDGKDDRLALGRRVAAEIDVERSRDQGRIVEAIAGVVADHKMRRAGEGRACDISALVDRDALDELKSRLKSLVDDGLDHVTFRVIEPLPLYNFVE